MVWSYHIILATRVGYAGETDDGWKHDRELLEFDLTSDSVSAYVERANLFFEANEVAEVKRVAVFLSTINVFIVAKPSGTHHT